MASRVGRMAGRCLLAFSVAMIAAGRADGEFVEWVVETTPGEWRVVDRRVYAGRVPQRDLGLRAGAWLVEALDARGCTRYRTSIADPRAGWADWLADDPVEADLLAGEDVHLDETVFAVRVPDDPAVTQIVFSQLDASGTAASLPPPGEGCVALLASPERRIGAVAVDAWDAGAPGAGRAGAAFTSYTLIDNGDPANRVDLVFLGDGFTAAEIELTYANGVRAVVDLLFGEPPFDGYGRYFNVHVVNVVSNESGVDHPGLGISRDTALDVTYASRDWRCLVSASPRKVLAAAAQAPAPADFILITVNAPYHGGCGFQFAVGVNFDPRILVHELGHTFGGLGDEYGGSGRYTGGAPWEPNLTIETERGRIPWQRWIDPATRLPTVDPFEGLPAGLYEGGGLYDTGIYRPTFDSKMRSNGAPWGAVNGEVLIKRMHAFVDPIDTHTPPEGAIDLASTPPMRFAVTPVDASLPALRSRWELDGVIVGEGQEVVIAADQVPFGSERILVASLRDDTPDVRDRASGPPLESIRRWTLYNGPVPTARPTLTPTATEPPTPLPTRTATATPTPRACTCDCNNNGAVTIDELVFAMTVALNGVGGERCSLADDNGDGSLAINEIVQGVGYALTGCPRE